MRRGFKATPCSSNCVEMIANLFAKAILRLHHRGDSQDVLREVSNKPALCALQFLPKQGSMSTVVNAPISGESRHGAKCREGSRPNEAIVRQ